MYLDYSLDSYMLDVYSFVNLSVNKKDMCYVICDQN